MFESFPTEDYFVPYTNHCYGFCTCSKICVQVINFHLQLQLSQFSSWGGVMGGLGVPDWLLPAEFGANAEPLGAQHLLSSPCIRCPRLGSITPFTAPMVMLDITSGRLSPTGIRNCKIAWSIRTTPKLKRQEETHWLNIFHGELVVDRYLPVGHHLFVARMIWPVCAVGTASAATPGASPAAGTTWTAVFMVIGGRVAVLKGARGLAGGGIPHYHGRPTSANLSKTIRLRLKKSWSMIISVDRNTVHWPTW